MAKPTTARKVQSKSSTGDWRSEAAEAHKEKSAGKRFKLKEGDNVIRILPRAIGPNTKSKAPFYRFMQHSSVGKDNGFATCGKNIHGEGDCWLCDHQIPKLAAMTNPKAKQKAESMVAKEQFAMQVAVLDSDVNKMRGPVLWFVPSGRRDSVAVNLLGYLKNPRVELVDQKLGKAICIGRTGTGMKDTRYGPYVLEEDPRPISDAMISRLKPFEELIDPYSQSRQEARYFGRSEEAPEEAEMYEETTDAVREDNAGEETGKVEEELEETTEVEGELSGEDLGGEEDDLFEESAALKKSGKKSSSSSKRASPEEIEDDELPF